MLFDVSRDRGRAKILKLQVARFAPMEKLGHGLGVGRACVFVADVRGEELDEAPRCPLAGAPNQSRKRIEAGAGEIAIGNWGNGKDQTS